MKDFADWLLTLIKQLFKDIADFAADIFIKLLELVLTALQALIAAIPVPQFMQDGLSSVLGSLPGEVWFFLSHLKLPQMFAVLGAAVAFRLVRKFATLFQW